jgi:hypothetical protein
LDWYVLDRVYVDMERMRNTILSSVAIGGSIVIFEIDFK